MGAAKDLFKKPEKLGTKERKASVGLFAWLSGLVVLILLALAWPSLAGVAPEAAVYVGLALVRLLGAFVAFACAVGASHVAYNWVENSDLGVGLEQDRGLIYLGVLIGACLIFARVVL